MMPVDPARANMDSSEHAEWRTAYVISGVAALVAAVIFRRWLSAEYSLLRNMGVFSVSAPSDTVDWLKLLRTHSLIGVTLLNGLDIINYALVCLITIGLYGALRHFGRMPMALAALLAFGGVTVYMCSNRAFVLLSLSHQYSLDMPEVQRQMLLSTAQTLLVLNDPLVFGTGVFWAFVFMGLSGLIISVIMITSGVFSRATGWVGIVAHGLGLGYFFTVALYPSLTFIPLSASAPVLIVWYVLIALRLFKLSRPESR
jgi:hypothetical protein